MQGCKDKSASLTMMNKKPNSLVAPGSEVPDVHYPPLVAPGSNVPGDMSNSLEVPGLGDVTDDKSTSLVAPGPVEVPGDNFPSRLVFGSDVPDVGSPSRVVPGSTDAPCVQDPLQTTAAEHAEHAALTLDAGCVPSELCDAEPKNLAPSSQDRRSCRKPLQGLIHDVGPRIILNSQMLRSSPGSNDAVPPDKPPACIGRICPSPCQLRNADDASCSTLMTHHATGSSSNHTP